MAEQAEAQATAAARTTELETALVTRGEALAAVQLAVETALADQASMLIRAEAAEQQLTELNPVLAGLRSDLSAVTDRASELAAQLKAQTEASDTAEQRCMELDELLTSQVSTAAVLTLERDAIQGQLTAAVEAQTTEEARRQAVQEALAVEQERAKDLNDSLDRERQAGTSAQEVLEAEIVRREAAELEVLKLSEALEEQEKAGQTLTTDLAALKLENAELAEAAGDAAKNEAQARELDGSRLALTAAHGSIGRLETVLNATAKERDTARARVNELTQAHSIELIAVHEALSESVDGREALRRSKQEIEEALADARARLAESEKAEIDILSRQSERESQDAEMATLKLALESTQQDHASSRARESAFQEQLEATGKALDHAREERRGGVVRIDALASQLADATAELTAANAALLESQADLSELRANATASDHGVLAAEAERDAMAAELAEVRSAQGVGADQLAALKSARAEVEALKQAKADPDVQRGELAERLVEMERTQQTLEDLREAHSTTTSELEAVTVGRNEALRLLFTVTKDRDAGLLAAEAAKVTRAQSEKDLETARIQHALAIAEISEVNLALADSRTALTDATSAQEAAAGQLSAAEEELTQLKEALKTATEEGDSARKRATVPEYRFSEFETSESDVDEKLEQVEAEKIVVVQRQSSTPTPYEEGATKLTPKLSEVVERLAELSRVHKQLGGERDQLGATLTDTQKRLKRAEKTAERARSALTNLAAERDALKARLESEPGDEESVQLAAAPSLLASPDVTGELQALLEAIIAQRESTAKSLASWEERETRVGKTIGSLLKIASTIPQLQSGDSNIYGVLGDLKSMLNAGEGSLTVSVAELQAREDALRDVLGRLTG